jgi:molybdopterin-guanine dinucleotide biosynthesis protein
MKEIEKEYKTLTKKLVKELREKGLDVNSIKVEIDGNESRDDYTVSVKHKI